MLSGVYSLSAPSGQVLSATWVFTASGGFARTWTLAGGRGDRQDAGTYVIDADGRLVLYVEQRGPARLGTADRTILKFAGDPATALVVTLPDERVETLVRTGDEPARGKGGPEVE